jgi:hypothetical protein
MNEKLDYFIVRTERDIEELKSSHSSLHGKVDKLLEFKWQIIGGSVVISAVVGVAIQIIIASAK